MSQWQNISAPKHRCQNVRAKTSAIWRWVPIKLSGLLKLWEMATTFQSWISWDNYRSVKINKVMTLTWHVFLVSKYYTWKNRHYICVCCLRKSSREKFWFLWYVQTQFLRAEKVRCPTTQTKPVFKLFLHMLHQSVNRQILWETVYSSTYVVNSKK